MKRLIDIMLSAVGIVALLPLFAILAIAIKADSKGPVIFRQERIGRHGVPFSIRKFRTMTTSDDGPSITVAADSRVTKTGRVLRKYKLDEFPQLTNVIRGQMSLVGPRPEVAHYVNMWPAPMKEAVLSVRPGITDPASITFRSESEILATSADPETFYINVLMPKKLDLYASYIENQSLRGDIRLIGLTLRAITKPTHGARGH